MGESRKLTRAKERAYCKLRSSYVEMHRYHGYLAGRTSDASSSSMGRRLIILAMRQATYEAGLLCHSISRNPATIRNCRMTHHETDDESKQAVIALSA